MTFSFDFSKDKPNISEPIPAGTKVLVRMSYTPGGVGPNNALTQSRDTDAQYLKAEFTVMRGPYKGRKIFENMTVAGGKVDEKGNSIAAGITRGNIRMILDASSGISSKDESPQACAKRVLPNGFADLQGRVFVCKVGIEKANGNYPARNKLGTILTLDHKDYPKDESELDNPTIGGGSANAPAAMPAPAWGAPAAAAEQAQQAQQTAHNHIPPYQAPAQPMEPLGFAMPAPAAAVAAGAAGQSPVPAWMQG